MVKASRYFTLLSYFYKGFVNLRYSCLKIINGYKITDPKSENMLNPYIRKSKPVPYLSSFGFKKAHSYEKVFPTAPFKIITMSILF